MPATYRENGCMHHCTTQITTTGLASCKALALVVAIATSLPAYVAAAEPATARVAVVNFDIPMGDLSIALERFSTQSGRQVMYRQDLIAGKRAHAVNGALSPEAGLQAGRRSGRSFQSLLGIPTTLSLCPQLGATSAGMTTR